MNSYVFAEYICRLITCAALLILSIKDLKSYEIPPSCTAVIFGCGIWNLYLMPGEWKNCLAGMVIVSLPLSLLEYVSKGRAIGGGDIKLMAAAGLLLGWEKCLLAFAIACISASLIHPVRMKWGRANRVLAFGPYLSLGIFISLWWGDVWIEWYLKEWCTTWMEEEIAALLCLLQ